MIFLASCAWFLPGDQSDKLNEHFGQTLYLMIHQYRIILACTLIGSVSCFMFIFVPWKKGPEWWVRFSPYLYYSLVHLVYVVIPIGNIFYTLFIWIDPTTINCLDSLWFSGIILYLVMQICKVSYYFRIIRQIYLRHAIEYWHAHNHLR